MIFLFLWIFFREAIGLLVYCMVVALILSLFVVVDMHLMLAKGHYSLSTKDYILGAMVLSLVDLVMFIYYFFRWLCRPKDCGNRNHHSPSRCDASCCVW